jgi:hypothetical protein
MPLHDWTDRPGWEGVHHLWITELLRWIKPRLPEGYRAYIGSAPTVAVGAPAERPDVSVREWKEDHPPDAAPTTSASPSQAFTAEPDEEIAVAALDSITSLFVEMRGRLVAAVELVSPRNKDRPIARATYLARYVGYLLQGVHLLLVDVHRRPLNFSFADSIAQELHLPQQSLPAPLAISYRVGEPAASGGKWLATWRRPLRAGEPLPNMDLALTVKSGVSVDLEQTYMRAAADAYLS